MPKKRASKLHSAATNGSNIHNTCNFSETFSYIVPHLNSGQVEYVRWMQKTH